MTDTILPIHLVSLEYRGNDRDGEGLVVGDWLVRSFELQERICEPYTLMLSLSSQDSDLCVAALVGGRCSLVVGRGEFERSIHGIVIKAEAIGTVRDMLRFRLWVGPSLEILALSRRLRFFQGKTVLEIVSDILGPLFERHDGGLDDSRIADMRLRVRDACVQYEESDLQFVQRLLAEEGIAYTFTHDHDDNSEIMILMPATACLHSAAGETETTPLLTPIRSTDFELGQVETLQSFRGSARMRPTKAEVSMWDWKNAAPTTATARQDPFKSDTGLVDLLSRYGEVYEHEPYRPVEEQEGSPLYEQLDTEVAFLGHRVRIDDVQVTGRGIVLGFTDGATFQVDDHPTQDLDGNYVVTSVTHSASFEDGQDGVVTQGKAVSVAVSYSNGFQCHRYEAPGQQSPYTFVPPRRPKPRASGILTATVVGPPGEEIHTDEHGRIRVRMHWDREGRERGDHETSCWVPVSQTSAGPGYGAVFIPRVGMEVVVAFIAGDPDRPLCTGVVYNGMNRPPYPLPDSKTRSVIRTSSSPGGDGYNELSFEDAAGAEEVFLHAQKNLRETVKANQTTSVGAHQSLSVGEDRNKTISGSETNVITKDQSTTIGGVRATTVEGAESTVIRCGPIKGNNDQSITSGYSQLLVQGTRKVWAKKELILEVGPAGSTMTRVSLTPTGITIEASDSFNITIGGKARVDILPTIHQVEAETVKSIAKASAVSMDDAIHVEAKKLVRLAQGKGDKCQLVLDGDAKTTAADVTLVAKGTAAVAGATVALDASKKASLSGKAGVAVDSTANVTITAGGEATVKGTVSRVN